MRLMYLFTIMIFAGCAMPDKYPGSAVKTDEAIKKSMVVPLSDTLEMKYKKPLVAICRSIEEPVEPGQIIIDTCNFYQQFIAIKIISGNIERKFRCDYTIILSKKEKKIKKGHSLILILRDEKADKVYYLVKAMVDNEKNRKKIERSINAQAHLINWP